MAGILHISHTPVMRLLRSLVRRDLSLNNTLRSSTCSTRLRSQKDLASQYGGFGPGHIRTFACSLKAGTMASSQEDWLPIQPGWLMNDRYQVIGNLGSGPSSTIWLAQDKKSGGFFALKALSRCQTSSEVKASDRFTHIPETQGHPGPDWLRKVHDHFSLRGPSGVDHECLVLEPCGMNVLEFRNQLPGRVYDKRLAQLTIIVLTAALDVLHQIGIVHTEVCLSNVLCGVLDQDVFTAIKQEQESQAAAAQRASVSVSRPLTMPHTYGRPKLAGFSSAVVGLPGQQHKGEVTSKLYRAPEVILDMPWNDKIDIWAIGLAMWELLEGKHLFHEPTQHSDMSDEQCLAEMVALLGPPPKTFLKRSAKCERYWNADGTWKAKTRTPRRRALSRESSLRGKDRTLLLNFLRKVLQWLPEDRAVASELFDDPFLGQWSIEDISLSL